VSAAYEHATALVRRIYDKRLSDPPVLDVMERFSSARRYVDEWPALRDEALRLAEEIADIPRFHELMAEQESISAYDGRDWRVFVLKAYGVRFPDNLERSPVLAKLLESTPEVLSATYSFLAPQKHIPRHRGPFRGILRYYLGLSIPTTSEGRPQTVLTIDGADYRIGSGGSLLWDDTFSHEVRNDSDRPRIALLLDVRRHGMPWDLECFSRILIAAVRTAIRLRRLA
jgi:aspartate beta-hydroxylase